MWSDQPLEELLYQKLASLPSPFREALRADYMEARRFVTQDITSLIPSREPDLTDHTDRHLADVMARARSLIDGNNDYLRPYELYLLCVSILFHDVGNLHGRQEHQKKIATIYDACRHGEPRFNTERRAVLAIAGAHTGSTKDGSKDTLRDVKELPFNNQTVRGAEIAAILRLADELAEGPQRTSAYALNHGGYKAESHIFHHYASAVDYLVTTDKLALTLNINVKLGSTGVEVGAGVHLSPFLEFCYKRVSKVDEERRYCKHYCSLLSYLRETSAWFSFWLDGEEIVPGIDPIVLTDLMIPGEHPKNIVEIDSRYDPASLSSAIASLCGGAV